MRWDRGHQSDYVEDRRGQGGHGGSFGGMGLLFLVFRRFGIGGVIIALVVFGALQMFGGGGSTSSVSGRTGQDSGEQAGGNDELKAFVSFVLDDLQSTWTELYAAGGKTYRPAHLVLFSDRVQSGCGGSSAATGPFYCPADERVYIDLSFYQALRDRLGAPGDFAQAYVIAHEVGHHIQNLERSLAKGRDEGEAGGSVRVELMADCYAGVWAHSARARKLLEVGDLEEALTAASAIGDDKLQGSSGAVRPETFTHGTSAQRMRWFRQGYDTGKPAACDTFAAQNL